MMYGLCSCYWMIYPCFCTWIECISLKKNHNLSTNYSSGSTIYCFSLSALAFNLSNNSLRWTLQSTTPKTPHWHITPEPTLVPRPPLILAIRAISSSLPRPGAQRFPPYPYQIPIFSDDWIIIRNRHSPCVGGLLARLFLVCAAEIVVPMWTSFRIQSHILILVLALQTAVCHTRREHDGVANG